MLQAHTDDQYRGRVFATMDVLWQTGRLISLGVGGILADTYGIQVVYYLGGALLLAAAATGFTSTRPGSSPCHTG
jgi:predicted MFS family arabinose efflux permease